VIHLPTALKEETMHQRESIQYDFSACLNFPKTRSGYKEQGNIDKQGFEWA
jgi:hypothetical protein